MCSELFFIWGMLEMEYQEQIKENIKEELREKGWNEEKIEDYLSEIGLV